ncbi:hypothetical protein GALMADRAFT_214291 [Galerina marginata CBS 339.88]|uniref:DJ-1/PfpI domain-containing protein n=1 Tax=Galerina marginata (strain CBS 339.88) TaxID=685588 RepID=A0A067SJ61_GALM3|nr:hypothetical protein GALMADRAFT_214291 [Galerina marginata CBS 339.88]
MSPNVYNFGLILFDSFQWLDAAGPVDYLNNHSYPMISILNLPQSLIDKAPIINWHYVSSDLTPVQATSGPPQVPTCTFDDCPPLDYIVIPGGEPTMTISPEFASFVKKRVEDPGMKTLLLICTASLAIAQTGILDGRQTCSNKMALKSLAEVGMFNRKVKWIRDRRWIKDGKVWSSAGATAGVDLAAEFARVHFDAGIVQVVKDVMEYEPNPAQPDPFAKLLEGVDLS